MDSNPTPGASRLPIPTRSTAVTAQGYQKSNIPRFAAKRGFPPGSVSRHGYQSVHQPYGSAVPGSHPNNGRRMPVRAGPKYQLVDPGVVGSTSIPTPSRQVQPRLAPGPQHQARGQAATKTRPPSHNGRDQSREAPSPRSIPPPKQFSTSGNMPRQGQLEFPRPRPSGSRPSSECGPFDTERTPTLTHRQSSSSVASVSSSTYSSASAMARAKATRSHRPTASQVFERPERARESPIASPRDSRTTPRPRQSMAVVPAVQSPVIPHGHGDVAPYLVNQTGPKVTLAWEPDPESAGVDPMEEIWKKMYEKLGRKPDEWTNSQRGRWVVKELEEMDLPSPFEEQAPISRGMDLQMSRQESDFSVSDYLHPNRQDYISTDGGSVNHLGTALFDMSAPLIPSVSTRAATPVNTPCMRSDSLQRTSHVIRNSRLRSSHTDSNSDTDSSEDVDSLLTFKTDTSMYRLDSHIVSALEALQADFDSPELDYVLSLKPYDVDSEDEDGRNEYDLVAKNPGLGLAVPVQINSTYGLASKTSRR